MYNVHREINLKNLIAHSLLKAFIKKCAVRLFRLISRCTVNAYIYNLGNDK